MQPVKSGMLTRVGYDPASGTLAVEYSNGGLYHYAGIPPDLVSELLAAESVGKYFLTNIRNAGFTATRIEPEPEDRADDQ
jgi:KTSC domain-containing protein